MVPVHAVKKPWWQQATALVTVSAGGIITGFNFVPGAAATMTSPTSVPLHLLALQQAAQPGAFGDPASGGGASGGSASGGSAATVSSDAQLRAAVVNVASYYLRLAGTRTAAQMETLIWDNTSSNGADHGASCAAFASLTLELAAQAVGQQSWVSGGTTYPWPMPAWADVRVGTNPASPGVESLVADAEAHDRWHPLADGYRPQPGDWVVFNGHVEVVTSATGSVLHTIGADSLPGLTVNAHSFGVPLAGQGVVGFVDNGHLKAASATVMPATGTPGAGTPGAGATAVAGPAVPGVPAPGDLLGGIAAGGSGQSGSAPASRPATGGSLGSAGAGTGSAEVPGLSAGAAAQAAAARPLSAAAAAPTTPPAAPPTAKPSPAPTAAPAGALGTKDQQAFISLVAPGAIAAQQRYGVPAAVTIAQAIEESAWGRSGLAAQYHNLFGIKGTGPAGSVSLPTSEYVGGQWETIDARFRVYHNDAESISDHAELLATSGYYARAMADRAVPDAFANDLTGVYATDPAYGANLIALMKLYNLYQYDGAGASSAAAPSAPSTPSAASAAASPAATPPTAQGGHWQIPGLVSPGPLAPAATVTARPATSLASTSLTSTPAPAAPVRARPAAQYQPDFPAAVTTAFFATAKGPLARGEHLYRDVAACAGISWQLLAAADWMECKADPRYSPVHGEKLGSVNLDGTAYSTKSGALAQCAGDLIELAAAVYGISLTARQPLPVRALAAAYAAFRWGAILRRHGVSPMEFPYSVAGLTAQHQKMHWPAIDAPDAPDRPGGKFRETLGAVPVVLQLGYPATL